MAKALKIINIPFISTPPIIESTGNTFDMIILYGKDIVFVKTRLEIGEDLALSLEAVPKTDKPIM